MTRGDERPTLGVYGPGPHAHSGVSRYIKESMPFLADVFAVRWVHDDAPASPGSFDYVLYHLGNSVLHHCAFRALRQRAGPVLLHEFNTFGYYLGAWELLDDDERKTILSLLGYEFGRRITSLNEAKALASQLPDDPRKTWDIGVECLALRRARPAVVHSAKTSALLQTRHPSAIVRHVPLPVTVPPSAARTEVRARLGIPPGNFVFGVLGFLSPAKRIAQIVATWNGMPERPGSWTLLIAGERIGDVNIVVSAGMLIADGYWSDNEFDELLDAVDCGIQLRDPSMGETSGVVASLVARGTPVIVNDRYQALAPAGCPFVIRISTGDTEQDELRAAMRRAVAHRPPATGARGPGGWREWTAAVVDIVMGEGHRQSS